jgi:hypothetical protein
MLTLNEHHVADYGANVAVLCAAVEPKITSGREYRLDGESFVWVEVSWLLSQLWFWSEDEVVSHMAAAESMGVLDVKRDPDESGVFIKFRWNT